MRVDDTQIGVAAAGDHTFLGIETKDARRVGAGNLHKARQRHPSLAHALTQDQRHRGLESGDPRRNLLDGLARLRLFLVAAITTVIGADALQRAVGQRGPERGLICGGAQGRRAEEKRAILSLVSRLCQPQVMAGRFAPNGLTALPCLADRRQRSLLGDMHDVEWALSRLGQVNRLHRGKGFADRWAAGGKRGRRQRVLAA